MPWQQVLGEPVAPASGGGGRSCTHPPTFTHTHTHTHACTPPLTHARTHSRTRCRPRADPLRPPHPVTLPPVSQLPEPERQHPASSSPGFGGCGTFPANSQAAASVLCLVSPFQQHEWVRVTGLQMGSAWAPGAEGPSRSGWSNHRRCHGPGARLWTAPPRDIPGGGGRGTTSSPGAVLTEKTCIPFTPDSPAGCAWPENRPARTALALGRRQASWCEFPVPTKKGTWPAPARTPEASLSAPFPLEAERGWNCRLLPWSVLCFFCILTPASCSFNSTWQSPGTFK